MTTVEALQKRVAELEKKLESLQQHASRREKIAVMSSEVVDSNPYR